MALPKFDLGTFEASRDGTTIRYCIENITSAQRMDEALVHMMSYFLVNEPISKYLGINKDPVSKLSAQELWKVTLEEGYAIGAYLENSDGSKGKLLGVNITRISHKNEDHEEYQGGSFNIVLKLAQFMMRQANVYGRYGVDEFMEAFGLSVHPDYHGYNLGYRILQSREKLCERLGVKATATMFTAAASQHLAQKLNYEALFQIDYKDVEIDNKRVFEDIWERQKEKKCVVLAYRFS